jgi:hypothetical protein
MTAALQANGRLFLLKKRDEKQRASESELLSSISPLLFFLLFHAQAKKVFAVTAVPCFALNSRLVTT